MSDSNGSKAKIAERDKAIQASPSCIALVCLHLLRMGIARIPQEVARLESVAAKLRRKSGEDTQDLARLRGDLSQACCRDSFVLFALAVGIASVCRHETT